MKKGTFFSIMALLVSIVGITVAVAAYMKRRSCVLCDDIDEDMFMDDDCDCCDCSDDSDNSCDTKKDDCGCDSQANTSDHTACADSGCCCDNSDDVQAE